MAKIMLVDDYKESDFFGKRKAVKFWYNNLILKDFASCQSHFAKAQISI